MSKGKMIGTLQEVKKTLDEFDNPKNKLRKLKNGDWVNVENFNELLKLLNKKDFEYED